MRNGQLYAQPTLERPISASDSSFWPTPTAGDSKASGAQGYQTQTRNPGTTLTDAALYGYSKTKRTGRSDLCLNPLFVEWLMGLPPAWTDYAPSETP